MAQARRRKATRLVVHHGTHWAGTQKTLSACRYAGALFTEEQRRASAINQNDQSNEKKTMATPNKKNKKPPRCLQHRGFERRSTEQGESVRRPNELTGLYVFGSECQPDLVGAFNDLFGYPRSVGPVL